MGAEGPRSFSAIIASKRAEFISYREAITKLAEYTGEPLTDIAACLKQHRIHMNHMAFLSGAEQAVTKSTSSDALEALLDETIRTGAIKAIPCQYEGETAIPDLDGWMRSEFAFELTIADLPCPETLDTTGTTVAAGDAKSPAREVTADWAVALRGMASFKLWEAACVMAGVDPFEPDWGVENGVRPDEQAEIRRSKRLLTSAIDAGELPDSSWSNNRDEQEIPHALVREWCQKHGYHWPIPQSKSPPVANDIDLHERLRTAEDELDQLRIESSALKGALDLIDNLKEQLVEKEAELTELRAWMNDADEIATRVNQAETERDTALQIAERLKALVPPLQGYLMSAVFAAQRKFWIDWDENKPRPKSEIIKGWLKETYPDLTDAQCAAIDKVACPVNRDPGAK
ncbi:hypothetical protein LGM39_21450 [Burkholderia cepacia]|uniref:hypothetical protein n=1 Tax=Burkholderia cepacia TaxID=292 RepID=UPI001CF2FFFF|nr:hypothetical protein [Burkholderia cepacia]MCA7901940.1 hypothetical protein [Burkholderia cepacia]